MQEFDFVASTVGNFGRLEFLPLETCKGIGIA
jgi:hypothetical protein